MRQLTRTSSGARDGQPLSRPALYRDFVLEAGWTPREWMWTPREWMRWVSDALIRDLLPDR